MRIALITYFALMATSRAGEMVVAGTHPTSPSTPFATIHVLKAYEGRIYMGYGDWNVYPAVAVVSYDPGTATFHPEHSPGTDSVGQFRALGNDLWVPSIDPVHFDEFADFSVRSGGVWRRYAPAGFLHVLDVGTLTGSDLWLVGAKTANETSNSGAAVRRSTNGGISWTEKTVTTSQSRYYYCFTLRGKLYVHDTVYDDLTATRIPAFPYQRFYKPLNIGTGASEVIAGLAQLSPGIGTFSRHSLVSFDGTNWQALKTNVVDHTVAGSNLYTLDYNPISGSNELWAADYEGGNPVTWTLLPLSNVPANAKSIEVLGDFIYVGDTSGQLWVGRLDGNDAGIAGATVINELPDGFGRAIVVDTSTLAIGAPESSAGAIMAGEVTVWRRTNDASTSAAWGQPQILSPPQPIFSGWFGKEIALENGTLAVLEAGPDSTGMDRGSSAQIHLYEQTVPGWQWRQSLTIPYAQSVALKSNVLWVAASTVLHRYEVTPGTNGIVANLAESFASGAPSALYQPSSRVVADGTRAAFSNIGDISRSGGPGQVNVYERDAGGWRKVATLLRTGQPMPTGLTYPPDAFGFSMAMAGDWLVVSSPRDDLSAWQSGAVYLYQRTAVGTNVSYVARQRISTPVRQQDGGFGTGLAFDGEYLVIGAPGVHSSGVDREGRAFLYRLDGTNAVLVSPIEAPAMSQTDFGSAVALNGLAIIAGSRAWITNANPLARVFFSSVAEVVGAAVDLSVRGETSPEQAIAGIPVQYSIVASNAGPAPATAVVLTFQKPTNGAVTDFSSSSGTCTDGGDSITCHIPELAAASAIMLHITVNPTFGSSCELMRSRATVGATEFELHLSDNVAEWVINNFPPSIAMVMPVDGTTIRFGAAMGLAAEATATNGVAEVSFLTNGVLLGTSLAPPYTLTWTNLPKGTHAITARAVDACGLVSTSAAVTLVVASNLPPSVAIASPFDRTHYLEGGRIEIMAVALDPDGVVSSVEVYRGAILLGVLPSPPYRFTWTNAPDGVSVLSAVAIDNDGATISSAPVLLMVGNQNPGSNWIAYNDHGSGPATHPNATRWDIRGESPGASGALRDIATGAVLPVSVGITRVNPDNTVTSGGAQPAAGTPAAEVFAGYVDFLGGTHVNVTVPAAGQVSYTFTGLNPARVYSLKMTAIRGASSYADRWTLMTLNGAQSFRSTHSAGALIQGKGPLAANQVAINTGFNVAGEIASWDDIICSPGGTITVVSTQYTGPIPGGGTGASAPYGYAPTVVRLEEASFTFPRLTNSTVSQTVSLGATPTFAVEATCDGPITYQWFQDNMPIPAATAAVLTLPPVVPSHVGRYSVRASATNGHAMSKPAVLTLFSINQNRELELWGPVGQSYLVESRAHPDMTDAWIALTNFVLSDSPLLLIDTGTSNSPQRFYRSIATP